MIFVPPEAAPRFRQFAASSRAFFCPFPSRFLGRFTVVMTQDDYKARAVVAAALARWALDMCAEPPGKCDLTAILREAARASAAYERDFCARATRDNKEKKDETS